MKMGLEVNLFDARAQAVTLAQHIGTHDFANAVAWVQPTEKQILPNPPLQKEGAFLMKMGLGISLVVACAQAVALAQHLYKIYLIGWAESTSLRKNNLANVVTWVTP